MLAGRIRRSDDPLHIYHFQYAFYTMLARAMLLKRGDVSGILGYSGGIQPGLLAAEIFTARDFPAEVDALNLDVADHAMRNRAAGVSACCVDFGESDWTIDAVLALVRDKFDDRIFLQDRRAPR